MTTRRAIASTIAAVCVAVLACCLAALAPAAAATAKRVALVVGIADYKAVAPLKNTRNDAERMADTLTRLGFEVTKAIDPGRGAFEEALRGFGAKARQAEASVFFYAGHAIEVEGRNWLLPADAKLETKLDLRFEAIDVEAVLDQAQASRIAVMFLDACRNNPFSERLSRGVRGEASRGLARIDPAAGVLVAFATAPGQVALDGQGDNSPFTEALLKHIETPGLEIRQLMARVRSDVRRTTREQVPWEQSALEGEFFFKAPPPVVAVAPPPALAAPPPAPPSLDPEALFWDSVRDSESETEISAYLDKFPQGLFAPLARNRLAQLRRQKQAAAPANPPPAVIPAPPIETPPVASPPSAAPPATAPARQTVAVAPPATPPVVPAPPAVSPQPPAPPTAPPVAATPAAPALDEAGLVAELAALGPATATREARAYIAARGAKALARASTGAGVWQVAGRAGATEAEESALEACQFVHRTPCRLVASGDKPGGPELRSMARLFYAGGVNRDWIPFVPATARADAAIAAYPDRAGGKAIALHPEGRLSVRFAADQRAAEEGALKDCGAGCYLYAAGDTVVLSRRLMTPAAPPAVAALTPPPPPAAPAVDPAETVRQIKAQMKRVGCYAGGDGPAWDAGARQALADLGRASRKAFPKEPGPVLLAALSKEEGRVCPLVCRRGFEAKGESCVEIVCDEGEFKNTKGVCVQAPVARRKPPRVRQERPVVRQERPVVRRPPPVREVVRPAPPKPRPVVTRPRPEPSGGGGGRCFTAGGRQYCS